MRRATDFVMMVAVGVMAVVALLGGIAGAVHVAGPHAPLPKMEQLWMLTGVGGFLLGLSWRFLFWDLPAMTWHLLSVNRRNLQYLTVLTAGIAILVFI